MIRRLKWTLVLLIWLIFIAVGFLLVERSAYGGGDFHQMYRAVKTYLPQQIPYRTLVDDPYYALSYPPLLPQLLIPLVKPFDQTTATRIWYALSLGALIVLLAALARFIPARRRFTFWIVAVLFMPVFEALRIGQVSVILLALIGFAWVSAKTDRRVLAGVLLAVAAWIKIYPALLIVYFLWKRDWRAVGGALIGGIGLALFQIAVSGLDVFLEFFRALAFLAGEGETNLIWKSSSIYGFAAKLFGENERVIPLFVNPLLLTITRYGLIVLVLGALFILISSTKPSAKPQSRSYCDDDRFDLEFALSVITMLLVSPWVYIESMTPAFLTFFILWRHGLKGRDRLLFILAGVLVTASYLMIWQPADSFNALLLSVGFYALALIWVINVLLLVRDSQTDHAAVELASETT